MRPTDIGIRIPVNRSPCTSPPRINSTGNPVLFGELGGSFAFQSSKRFGQYDRAAKKFGFNIGPGRYRVDHTDMGVAKVSTFTYKANRTARGSPREGYYYSGNLLIYDPAVIPNYRQKAYQRMRRTARICQERTLQSPEQSAEKPEEPPVNFPS